MREMCKSKIHRATVTEVNPDYVGSLTLDQKLMEEARIYPYEKVQVASFATGTRFETYVIEGPKDSGVVGVNGAAALLARVGDEILIISYGLMDDREARGLKPRIIHVDKQNRIVPSPREYADTSV